VAAPVSELAHQIATVMVEEMERYNTQRRRLAISAERAFVQQQVTEARATLTQAENNLERFLELNREYRASPKLNMDKDRLEREVMMRHSCIRRYPLLMIALESRK
jgi:uncharacterized protein involved in exopolysaccharide biosynthesis